MLESGASFTAGPSSLKNSQAGDEVRIATDGFVRLLQITSPALPIGAFAYSHGLERAVEFGWVHDAPTAQDWIEGVLKSTLAACEIPVLARLYRAFVDGDDAGARAWSAWLWASRPTAELQAEDRQLGTALARVLVSLGLAEADRFIDDAHTTHACLFALACARWQVPIPAAAVAFLFAWVEGQVGAAVKLVPLGQTDGQRILWHLGGALSEAVRDGLSRQDADIGGSLVGHAMASALHETQYSRLFRS
ncbi:MAG TPA: urease accessory protein UreF [Polyangiaceae bacterium]|nr:urease accessory protein UreF [Polyangiaceae bacterium]